MFFNFFDFVFGYLNSNNQYTLPFEKKTLNNLVRACMGLMQVIARVFGTGTSIKR